MNKTSAQDVLDVIDLEEKYEKMLEKEPFKYPRWWNKADYKFRKEILTKAILEKKNVINLDEVISITYNLAVGKLLDDYNKFKKSK